MSRKDYKAIAEIISRFDAGTKKSELIEGFCLYLKQDNPRFQQMKFIDACYKENETP
jgi:hypothetical protein